VHNIGEDDQSKELEATLDEPSVLSFLSTDEFVCIRVSAKSAEHDQFAQICKFRVFF